ncbi:MAG: spore coat protein CotJB [Clostridia bacterium]|nr:spore coat protein CotJB [Clostridia bacterium]
MYCYPMYPYPGYCKPYDDKPYCYPDWCDYNNAYDDYDNCYDDYMDDCGDMNGSNDKIAALKSLMAIQFSLLELNLYLDTHPRDMRAIRKYNEYLEEYKEKKEEYEQKYGPITARTKSGCPWEYIKGPWPWDIEYK